MTTYSAQGRTDPPYAADEAATLIGFLRYQRDTLRWKCSGLSAEQLAATLPPTTITLGGLLMHLAVVEAGWLNLTFAGGVARPSWIGEMEPDDDDWSFDAAARRTPAELFAVLDESAAVSDRVIADALATPEGLGALAQGEEADGAHASLRWILCHLVEEYARHNGHADLLRQAIDGETGE
ncbi:MAG TPA: DinB family protein [Candidatus Nanopelagicales bacterium]|nr:DinB family protein [Candidatus Nanopelagicales bacterium]